METNHSTHRYWYGKVLNIPHNSSDMHALQSIKERDGSKTWSVILNKQLNSVSWDKDKTQGKYQEVPQKQRNTCSARMYKRKIWLKKQVHHKIKNFRTKI